VAKSVALPQHAAVPSCSLSALRHPRLQSLEFFELVFKLNFNVVKGREEAVGNGFFSDFVPPVLGRNTF
jgi:hypothetical protein